jgi:rhamnose utilization protein RhaD (predicted bifunctional aldolase and dehydrogenase)/NAD(P)-dependent dehydrogenase (short-subunit alcohol dehydrogenase family)
MGSLRLIDELLARAHVLGADRRNTNYAGGNASAKGATDDPVTGSPVEVMWVKGSGGDLGTLTEAGLAVLRLDRLRALVAVYPGVDREDEMVAAFDYCLHGRGGAAPSIDTAMHGLVDAPHVDHLHPDSGIALATAADGEELTRKVFGGRVLWVPWRRPGFQLGLDIAALHDANPKAIGCVLGGHGITAWGATSAECQANSLEIIRTAERYLAEHGDPEPFGPVMPGYEPLPTRPVHDSVTHPVHDSARPVHDLNYGTNQTTPKVPETPDQPVRKGRSHGFTAPTSATDSGSSDVTDSRSSDATDSRSSVATDSRSSNATGSGSSSATGSGSSSATGSGSSSATGSGSSDATSSGSSSATGSGSSDATSSGSSGEQQVREQQVRVGSAVALDRRDRAAALFPVLRRLASTDARQVGHFTDSPEVLDFLSRAEHPRLAALGTSCPDHFLRTKVAPLVVDLPAAAPLADVVRRVEELHASYREDYAAYYHRHAVAGSPPMRGADPAIFLVPGVGMFSFGRDKQTARVAGEFYVNAINVMRGAEAVSRYSPISEAEKFRIEYWDLEEAKLRRMPKPKPLATRIALVTGGGSGIGRAVAQRLAAEGACVVVADRDAAAAAAVASEVDGTAVVADVTSEDAVADAVKAAVLAYGGVDLVVNNAGLSVSKPLVETTAEDWDRQHSVMARGSFLVSREAARVMITQDMGGDIVYVVSKNGVFAGPNNVAYGATKADQAHQVRLLAAELGPYGIRVNGVNPDGVVRGSGIFASGWGAQRAAVYGVPEEKLGEFYAQRTLLKREVLPEHVANAVFVLTTDELSHTTGMHVPVDAGVAAAFLR